MPLTALVILIAALATVAAAAGLLVPGGAGGFEFTSVHGQVVQMYGRGLYQYDSLTSGSGFRGIDVVVLVLGVPLLVAALVAYRRGSMRGHVLLAGTLAFFLEQYACMAFGAAFNPVFPLYIALFGLSLFAFAAAAVSVDREVVARSISARLPPRGIAGYLFLLAAVLVAVWGAELIGDLAAGRLGARIDSYTTIVLFVVDLGVLLPATLAGAALVLRGIAGGYVVASVILVLTGLMGPAVVAMTISQIVAGVTFAAAEVIGPTVGFGLLAAGAIALAAMMLGSLPEPATLPDAGLHGALRRR